MTYAVNGKQYILRSAAGWVGMKAHFEAAALRQSVILVVFGL